MKRGQTKAYLKRLRKKYKLGEFARKARRRKGRKRGKSRLGAFRL